MFIRFSQMYEQSLEAQGSRKGHHLGRYHCLPRDCTKQYMAFFGYHLKILYVKENDVRAVQVWHCLQRGYRYALFRKAGSLIPHVSTISDSQGPSFTCFLLPKFLLWLKLMLIWYDTYNLEHTVSYTTPLAVIIRGWSQGPRFICINCRD